MRKLFGDSDGGKGRAKQAMGGQIVGVAVATNVWGTYDYLWPDSLASAAVGQRVTVPFGRGNRRTLGFVAEIGKRPGGLELKAVAEVLDPVPQLDASLWELGRWIARYYMTPLGMTLAAMIPSAVGRRPPKSQTVVSLAASRRDWPSALGAKQRRILDELLEAKRQGVEPLTLEKLLAHSGGSRDSIRRLARRGLVRTDSRPVQLPSLADPTGADEFDLNEDQQAVMSALDGKLALGAGFSVTLLYGVTGSGKTEVYIRAIKRAVADGRQTIVLVPEIALATQTLQRFLSRLSRVAVLHSQLTDAQRGFYYQQIRDGHADVVVGPRSAIFAPTRNLGLIIVDEEHEPTYKQDTAPRYHARDVAIKRASLTDVPVILGSATPSLESLHNVKLGRYDLLRLPRRVRGLPMPALSVVNLRKETRTGRIELLGRTLTHKMAAALDRGEQIILLMNRRGYANYVFCPSCQWQMQCDNCTRPMIFHQATQLAMCHYCQATAPLPEACPACRGKLLLFGLGIQRIESELARKFPTARMARMDSDTMTSARQFHEVFEKFTAGELDILLGTQMVAKGLDFPRVSLVGVVSADTSLAIPDFRASERTFQLIVQVAGRAGRAEMSGEVVVQTLHADEPAIRYATNHDYDGFAGWELPQRLDAKLPPYSRMVRFLVRHESPEKTRKGCEKLTETLRYLLSGEEVRIIGPMPAGVLKIRNQFRYQIIITTAKAGTVQEAVGRHIQNICRENPAEVIVDVDPINLV